MQEEKIDIFNLAKTMFFLEINENKGNELRRLCWKNSKKFAKSSRKERVLFIDNLVEVVRSENLSRFLFRNKDSGNWEIASRKLLARETK